MVLWWNGHGAASDAPRSAVLRVLGHRCERVLRMSVRQRHGGLVWAAPPHNAWRSLLLQPVLVAAGVHTVAQGWCGRVRADAVVCACAPALCWGGTACVVRAAVERLRCCGGGGGGAGAAWRSALWRAAHVCARACLVVVWWAVVTADGGVGGRPAGKRWLGGSL